MKEQRILCCLIALELHNRILREHWSFNNDEVKDATTKTANKLVQGSYILNQKWLPQLQRKEILLNIRFRILMLLCLYSSTIKSVVIWKTNRYYFLIDSHIYSEKTRFVWNIYVKWSVFAKTTNLEKVLFIDLFLRDQIIIWTFVHFLIYLISTLIFVAYRAL